MLSMKTDGNKPILEVLFSAVFSAFAMRKSADVQICLMV